MMQSKLAGKLTAAVRNQLMPRVSRSRNLGAITGGGRAADPDTHAVDPEEVNDSSEAAKAAAPLNSDSKATGKGDDRYNQPSKPAFPPSESSPRIQSPGINQPVDPHSQQRRRRRYYSAAAIDADCVGIDGWPADEEDRAADGRRQRAEQEEDNKEYFKHHRASPLSELKIADTRKPITQASSGGAGEGYFGTPDVQVWRPEQIDTAEEAMQRAREIWMNNAIRGDPDSPHGRILRKLRGEDW